MRQYSISGRSIRWAVFATILGGAFCPAAVKYENSLRRVTATPAAGSLVVSMDATGEYRFEQFELSNPKRLVIDLIQLNNEVKAGRIPVADHTETVKDITVAQFRAKNPAITRVTMTLGNRAGAYNVVRNGSQMRVVFKKEAESAPAPAPAKPEPARPQEAAAAPGSQITQNIITSAASPAPAEAPPAATPAGTEPAAPKPAAASAASSSGHFQLASMQPNPRRIRVLPSVPKSSLPPENKPLATSSESPAAAPGKEDPAPEKTPEIDRKEAQPEPSSSARPTEVSAPEKGAPALFPPTVPASVELPKAPVPSPAAAVETTPLKPAAPAEEPQKPVAAVETPPLPVVAAAPEPAREAALEKAAPKSEAVEKKIQELEEAPVKVIPATAPVPEPAVTAQSAAPPAETMAAAEPPAVVQRIPLAKSPEEALASTFSSQSVLPVKSTASPAPSKPVITRTKTPSIVIQKPPAPSKPPAAADRKPIEEPEKTAGAGTAEIKVSQGGNKNLQATSTQYIGEEIDLKVKDLDLVDFFRMMSEISGLNISVDPDVSGKITMQMNAVPWDQIFDLALSTHKLERKIEGNVVRVSRKQTLQDEEKAIQNLRTAQLNSLEPQTVTVRLNYGDAEQVVALVDKQLSSKGTIIADKRTNTLILTDIPPRLEVLNQLIKNLDSPERQVRIEARVVQATRNFAQEVGVNLGFLAGYGERVTVGGPPVRYSSPYSVQPNVNLDALRNNGQIGVKIGSILDTFQLDAAITAGEQRGLAKLISRPSVSGQSNREATIRQGIRFPVQTIQNNTISIQYQDAALTLRVTPLITHENTIQMKLKVENNVADFTRVVNGIPSIKTNESETVVLVANGGTTVIGGILVDDDRKTTDAVPGLSSIPVFGNLFKKRTLQKTTDEVLFFITPTIASQ